MTLRDYLAGLNKLVAEHPEALELPVYYAFDDEGNGYQQVNNIPDLYHTSGLYEYRIEDIDQDTKPNLVIIN